ncbi:T9SS type A sorting domain-containing protein [Mesonia sp. K4-1]|uniref:T9SS type A sorting domain-containing protein n=1 Tax=Mesonia sp. K4-1 TaxID=2602760 RepID=UPI0011CAFF8F|nr:T9SS type A sorting domain-containing protein [Mesonia sp. K4-1]TXK73036.1 T9SS type A sorting domain-containing protein [Mesonia sp. K4-1]
MRKITFSILLVLVATLFVNAQINTSQNFNSSTSYTDGWSDDGAFAITPTGACGGNSARDNVWVNSISGKLYSPPIDDLSSGTTMDISFDYKIVDYVSSGIPINATQPGWGSLDVEYTLDQGTTWINLMTIDDNNHITSSSCNTINLTIPAADIPSGSDFQLRFTSHWLSGDFYVYLDNISAVQTVTSTPNCDIVMTSPTDGQANASTTGLITWSPATGGVVAYKLNIGTTSGGTDVVNQALIEGGDTFYNAGSLLQGVTYYVSIIPYNNLGESSCSEFQFTTFDVPVNDACIDAFDAFPLPYTNSQDVYGATNNDGFIANCESGMNDGVWYTVSGNGEEITVTVTETSVWDSELGIYTGSCGNFTCIDFSDSSNDTEEVAFTSVIGETYYINVGDFSGFMDNDEGAFDINITSSPVCSLPSDIQVNNITDKSATVTWVENGTATEWQVVYGPTNFDPTSEGTSVFDNDGILGIEISGLKEESTYDAYVFAVCDGSLSKLLGPTTFTTDKLSVGIQNFAGFSFYPNPTNSIINLKSNYQIEKLTLYDMLGKKVEQSIPNSLNTVVNLAQLNSGVYLLQVEINGDSKTYKVIKK